MSYSKLNALVENVRAIELAMKIRLQGRRATESEKEVLSRYSGFGGIKEVLNIGTNNPIDGRMAEPMQLSLFGDLFGDAAPASVPKPNLKSRPYTDAMLWWIKGGTLVEFEGQIGNLKCRRTGRICKRQIANCIFCCAKKFLQLKTTCPQGDGSTSEVGAFR